MSEIEGSPCTEPSGLSATLISILRSLAFLAPAGTFQQRSIWRRSASFSLIVIWASGEARCCGVAELSRLITCCAWSGSERGLIFSTLLRIESRLATGGGGFGFSLGGCWTMGVGAGGVAASGFFSGFGLGCGSGSGCCGSDATCGCSGLGGSGLGGSGGFGCSTVFCGGSGGAGGSGSAFFGGSGFCCGCGLGSALGTEVFSAIVTTST